jgi:hypothetical protein
MNKTLNKFSIHNNLSKTKIIEENLSELGIRKMNIIKRNLKNEVKNSTIGF